MIPATLQAEQRHPFLIAIRAYAKVSPYKVASKSTSDSLGKKVIFPRPRTHFRTHRVSQ